jgi:hypothetical protein
MPYAIVLPCLVGTFLFGPAGWLLYIALRSFWTQNAVPDFNGISPIKT